jgi:hypothetical protein
MKYSKENKILTPLCKTRSSESSALNPSSRFEFLMLRSRYWVCVAVCKLRILGYASVKTCFSDLCINYFLFPALLSQVNGYHGAQFKRMTTSYFAFELSMFTPCPVAKLPRLSNWVLSWRPQHLSNGYAVFCVGVHLFTGFGSGGRRAEWKGALAELGRFASVVCAL